MLSNTLTIMPLYTRDAMPGVERSSNSERLETIVVHGGGQPGGFAHGTKNKGSPTDPRVRRREN
jgi:hypothetical protein